MGQTRTSLLNIQKILLEIPPAFEILKKQRSEGTNKVAELANTAREGWNLMFMHLSDKFKAQGQTFDANATKTLKEVIDPGLVQLIKGVESWRVQMSTVAKKTTSDYQTGVAALDAKITEAQAEAARLKTVVEKKKGKLLASSKYKAKMKGYLEAIAAIDTMLAKQKATVTKAKAASFDDTWVNKYFTVKTDMKLADIEDSATMEAKGHMKAYLADHATADAYERVWRDEYKGVAGQLASMRTWANEADEMEAEAEEGAAPAKPDAKPTITGIVVKKGSTEVGRAPKAEFDRGSKMMVINKFTWKLKGAAQLDLLQQKVTVSGVYESGEGNFVNDMKVEGIKGDDVLKLKAV